jgi:hypothetical protein
VDINKKIENLMNLSEKEKYNYFIRKVVDFEEIWGLYNNGWALLGDEKNNQVCVFWPEKELAELCAIGKWNGYEACVIDLNDFLEKWITGMEKDNFLVSIFYNNQSMGKTVLPQQLRNDLIKELEQYE